MTALHGKDHPNIFLMLSFRPSERKIYVSIDEKFTAGHRCKSQDLRELRILVVHTNDKEFKVLDDREKDSKASYHKQ